MFNRSEVTVLTNKQTPLKTSPALCYATTLDKNNTARIDQYCHLWHDAAFTWLRANVLVVNTLDRLDITWRTSHTAMERTGKLSNADYSEINDNTIDSHKYTADW